jgi:hypothetical protein
MVRPRGLWVPSLRAAEQTAVLVDDAGKGGWRVPQEQMTRERTLLC